MRPLLFVDWSSVNARFTALMWAVAVVLALVVLVHVLPSGGAHAAHHVAAGGPGTSLVHTH
jgi:hypothetical protein